MPATATDRLYGLTTSVAVKPPCRVATTANIILSGLQTINGIAVAAGDRVLVKDQTNAVDNGIYVASTSAWIRAADFNGTRDVVNGTLVVVCQLDAIGAVNIYQAVATDPVVIGTSEITFMKVTNLTLSSVETQTATAGQTLFTLTEVVYSPGTNALQVFANGLRLVPEVDYVETSSTSVTLVNGSAAGDELLFSVALPSNVSVLSSAIGYTPGGAGAVPTNVQARLRAAWKRPEENGAAADGINDDTAAIQAAIDYLEASGAEFLTLNLSAKPYLCKGKLTITKPIQVVGQGIRDFDNSRPITRPEGGTWLIHDSLTGPLFEISTQAATGARLSNFGVFQTGHATPGAGWTPTVHDWVIRNEHTKGTLRIDRVHFHNVYLGILCDDSARPEFKDITGQFFYNALTFDRIYDVGAVDGLRSWTYWSEQNDVLQWSQANGKMLTFGRCDGMHLDNLFDFAHAITVYLGASPTVSGGARVINIGSLYSDFCGRALVVDNPVTHVTVDALFHLGQAWPSSPVAAVPGACGIHITSASQNSLVQVSNYYDVLAAGSSIKLEGTEDQVWCASTIIEQYDKTASGVGAVSAAATDLVFLGNSPMQINAAGATGPYVSGAGTVKSSVQQQHLAGANANKVVTAAAAAGQLTTITAEGEADAGISLVAKTTGIVNIAAAGNRLAFYGGASAAQGAVTGSRGGNAALADLITYLAARGLLTDSTTA